MVEEAPPAPEPAPEPESEEDEFLYMTALLVGVNLVLLLIGGGVYWWLRRSRQSDDFKVLEDGEPDSGEGETA